MKSALIAATLLLPAVWAAALPQAEEYHPEPREETSDFEAENAKIVGGTEATAGEFPYIVSLSQGGSHFCGGSLLNAYTVVTAGHCSTGVSASSVRVRAGSLVSCCSHPLPPARVSVKYHIVV
jgi:V8-like Glu-specific endopeptidase